MKKNIILLLMVFAMFDISANIGENFKKSGTFFEGGGSFFKDFYYPFSEDESRDYWVLSIAPGIGTFVDDNLKIGFGFSLMFTESTDLYSDSEGSYLQTDRNFSLGFNVSSSIMICDYPGAKSGWVPEVGVSGGVKLYPGGSILVDGITYVSEFFRSDLILAPVLRFNYFVSDRLAPYVQVKPSLGYILTYQDHYGNSEGYLSRVGDRIWLDCDIRVGVSVHIPSEKRIGEKISY